MNNETRAAKERKLIEEGTKLMKTQTELNLLNRALDDKKAEYADFTRKQTAAQRRLIEIEYGI